MEVIIGGTIGGIIVSSLSIYAGWLYIRKKSNKISIQKPELIIPPTDIVSPSYTDVTTPQSEYHTDISYASFNSSVNNLSPTNNLSPVTQQRGDFISRFGNNPYNFVMRSLSLPQTPSAIFSPRNKSQGGSGVSDIPPLD